MSEPTPEEIANCNPNEIDYTALGVIDLLAALDDDAAKWAKAYRQHALMVQARGDDPLDEGWLITWFANAIERSSDVRRWRGEPPTFPVLTKDLNPYTAVSVQNEEHTMSHVPKKTLPHPSETSTDAHGKAAVLLGVEQEAAGHYTFKNIKALQGDPLADGGIPIVIHAIRYETDPSQPAEPHGLDLS